MKAVFVGLALAVAGLAMGGAHAATDQQNKMTTCNAEAKTKELKGDERKKFIVLVLRIEKEMLGIEC